MRGPQYKKLTTESSVSFQAENGLFNIPNSLVRTVSPDVKRVHIDKSLEISDDEGIFGY